MNVGELLIRISADTSGLRGDVREARREIDRLPDEHRIRIIIDQNGGRGGRGSIENAAGNLGKMRAGMAGVISLAPILAAGIQVVVGAVGGLVSMLGDATIGTVSFGAVATAVLNDVIDAQKEITKAQEDMDKALTDDEKQTALENMAKAYRGLSEEQLAAVYSLQRFKSFWDDYTESFEKPVVIAFAKALEGFQYFIEKLRPTVAAASNAIIKVFDAANTAMKGADFTRFFDALSKSVGPVLETFGYVAIDVFQGLLNIMTAFKPVSGAMQSGLRGLSQAFLQWTKTLDSEKIRQFMDFVIQVGPQFITTLTSLMTTVNGLIKALAPLGAIMLGLVNIALATFNWFTAMALGWDSARSKADALRNSVQTLFNTIKMLTGYKVSSGSGSTADSIFDIDKAWQDWFGSIGDVTGGLKDAKKASDGFLASFDEVHSIKVEDGGGLTAPEVPKAPSIPTTPGNPWNQPEMDEPQAGGTDWIQKLIDKLKEIPPLIPLKIDPPDAGLPAVATAATTTMNAVYAASAGMVAAFSTLIAKMYELPPTAAIVQSMITAMTANIQLSSQTVQTSWHAMLDYMQSQLNAYNPYLMFGWDSLILTLEKLLPSSESVSKSWHAMLDVMQSDLNAFRPYIEFGLQLIVLALDSLVAAAANTAANWERAFAAIGAAVSRVTSPIVQNIESIKASYASLMAMLGQPISIPPIKLPELPKIEMPSIITDIQDTLKNFDYGAWFKEAAKGLGEAGVDIGLGLSGGKGIQGAWQAGKAGLPAVKAWLESVFGKQALTGFANGGIIGSDSIVRVGEKGRREAIIPLETSAMQPFASAIASSMGGSSSGGDIILQIDGTTFARLIAPYGVKESQRIGGSMIQTT